MALDRISITDFRNHAATALDGTARFNLLVGANGAGKTNVLEALSLLAPGRGLRRAKLPEMARSDGPGGFAIGAMLQPADGADLDAAGVQEHLRGCLANYKVPRIIEFQASLPRLPTGKILKRELRDPYWKDAGRTI